MTLQKFICTYIRICLKELGILSFLRFPLLLILLSYFPNAQGEPHKEGKINPSAKTLSQAAGDPSFQKRVGACSTGNNFVKNEIAAKQLIQILAENYTYYMDLTLYPPSNIITTKRNSNIGLISQCHTKDIFTIKYYVDPLK